MVPNLVKVLALAMFTHTHTHTHTSHGHYSKKVSGPGIKISTLVLHWK